MTDLKPWPRDAVVVVASVDDVAAGPVVFRYRTPGTTAGGVAAFLGLLLLGGTMLFLVKQPRLRR